MAHRANAFRSFTAAYSSTPCKVQLRVIISGRIWKHERSGAAEHCFPLFQFAGMKRKTAFSFAGSFVLFVLGWIGN